MNYETLRLAPGLYFGGDSAVLALVSSTSRASIAFASPAIFVSTMISSHSRTKELESLMIDDQRGRIRALCRRR